MPWTLDDYPNSLKNLPKVTKKKAIEIANALVEDGYPDERAIPIATSQAKEWVQNASETEKEHFLQSGKVTVHNHDYKSNLELLDKDELVIPHEEGWAVQAKSAKKAAKVFKKKTEAVQYAREIAQNKQTKLIIYKMDETIEDIVDYRK